MWSSVACTLRYEIVVRHHTQCSPSRSPSRSILRRVVVSVDSSRSRSLGAGSSTSLRRAVASRVRSSASPTQSSSVRRTGRRSERSSMRPSRPHGRSSQHASRTTRVAGPWRTDSRSPKPIEITRSPRYDADSARAAVSPSSARARRLTRWAGSKRRVAAVSRPAKNQRVALRAFFLVEPADSFDVRQLERQRPPEHAAVRRDEEAVARRVEHPVRVVLRDCDGETGREPAAGLAPRRAAVARDRERRAPLDDADDRRAGARRRDDTRQVDVWDLDLRQLGARPERHFVLDVDEDDAVHGADGGDHRTLPVSSAATTAVARRAADTGVLPSAREAMYAAENASPAPVGSVSIARAGTSIVSSRSTIVEPTGPRVTSTSGTPSSRTSPTASASSSASLSTDTCCRTLRSSAPLSANGPTWRVRTRPWPSQ